MTTCGQCGTPLEPGDKFCAACGTHTGAEGGQCSQCGSSLQADDQFCAECGASRSGDAKRCPSCATAVTADDKYCPSCGGALTGGASPPSPAGPVWRPEPAAPLAKLCVACQHFRAAKPMSADIPYWPGTPIAQALLKIEEDETKQRTSEAKHQANLIKTNQTEWGFRPLMSDYCAAKAEENKYEICELKNRAGDCPEFQAKSERGYDCATCLYLEHGQRHPYPPQGPHSAELYQKQIEAVDANIALEITSLYHKKGKPGRKIVVHDYCTHFGVARPYINEYDDCKAHAKIFGRSELFSGARGWKRRKE